MKLYSIKPLEWMISPHNFQASQCRYHYLIYRYFSGSFACFESGDWFANADTLEEAKQACQQKHERLLSEVLQPALTIEEPANLKE